MITGELVNDPVASEAAETAVLLATKGAGGGVVDAVIIDVSHPASTPSANRTPALSVPR